MLKLRKFLLWGVSLTLVAGCVMPYEQQNGAVVGGAVGGVAGAILDHHNPWRGGVIGAAVGALTGATIADVSRQASQQVAVNWRPVEYRMVSGRGYYHAEPITYEGRCRKVREKIYEDGDLVESRVIRVCREEVPYREKHKHKHKKHYDHDDDDYYDDDDD